MWKNPSDFIDNQLCNYKRNTWNNQENFVILMIEKEALAQIVYGIAKEYNVFVFPAKGFSSWSMFVKDLKDIVDYLAFGKDLIVLVLSDLDPSGLHIKDDYINKFDFMQREFGFSMPTVEKIAVTKEQ